MAEDPWGIGLGRGKLDEVGLIDTPDSQICLDKELMEKTFPALKEEITSEARNDYILSSIMLLQVSMFSWGTAVSPKCDAEGHIIGHISEFAIKVGVA